MSANFTTPAGAPLDARDGRGEIVWSPTVEAGVVIEHPNRSKAASKATRLVVVLLLLASALLMIVISAGAWDALAGAKALQLIYIVLYLALAFFVARWSRGVLPLIAALAMILLIFALVAVPGWLERDKDGFTDPAIASSVVALLTASDRAAAATADRVRDARLPAGLARRARAPRRRRQAQRRRPGSGLTGARIIRAARPGGGTGQTRWPQKPLALSGRAGSSPAPGMPRERECRHSDVQVVTKPLDRDSASVSAHEMNRPRLAFAVLIVGGAFNLAIWMGAALVALRMLT